MQGGEGVRLRIWKNIADILQLCYQFKDSWSTGSIYLNSLNLIIHWNIVNAYRIIDKSISHTFTYD